MKTRRLRNLEVSAISYGMGDNEALVGEAVKPFLQGVILATKFKIEGAREENPKETLLGKIRAHAAASLKRLETDPIDLYYQHRMNKDIHVEDIAWCMGQLIEEGLILAWGQSQSTQEEIRRAHAVTPLAAIQSENSLMERMFEKDVIPTCKELGIGFVPFSPLASGSLSGKYKPDTQYAGDDVRRVITRFARANFVANQPVLDLIARFKNERADSREPERSQRRGNGHGVFRD